MPSKTPARPPIQLSETDADRLFLLLDRAPADGGRLREELERAQVRAKVPDTVVAMNSTVEFLDDAHGETRTVQLVYPGQADIAVGKVSVLSPVGAGLLGLKAGQSIHWPDRDGRLRALRVLKVSRG
ncbi:nucleoside diphosphate kinase regulator [Phenylobacterium sp.]|uniref:nucleoside diphosphate kinase regulator n=1 Tax=Phenylobacterium sp. TaxID=1871053 RepID=UPI0027179ED7|nr:nucleoside diphosphate kinase regulator [Phenylobacterium sp.]MDO8799366.1 nucleoside diphosphate kinase regulator [Phenylobacterium sp.]